MQHLELNSLHIIYFFRYLVSSLSLFSFICSYYLACLIHKLYLFQSFWVKEVNPDLENIGFQNF